MTDTPPDEASTEPPILDLPTLTDRSDKWLSALAEAVQAEQEDRRNRAAIPGLVRSLASQYTAGGGDPGDLLDAVQHPEPPAEGEPTD